MNDENNIGRFVEAQDNPWAGYFDCISPNDIFSDVLDSFYNGERDNKSIV